MKQIMHNELAILIISGILVGLLIWSIRGIIVTKKVSYMVSTMSFLVISGLLVSISMHASPISEQVVPKSTETITVTVPDKNPNNTPAWVWVAIGIGSFLLICVIILIVRTRKV